MEKNKTVGLALGSGGFRGFAHIGVIKSLEKHGIPINFLSGSSIGSWVAAYYSIFKDINKMKGELIASPKENMLLFFDLTWTGGFVGGQKFMLFLEKNLRNNDFADAQIPLKILSTDLITGKPYVFEKGDLARAVRASTSVPLVFKPLAYQNKLLVDGGLSSPVPAYLTREMGADVVIAVNLYNKNEFIKKEFNVANIVARSGRIGLYNLAQESLKAADIVIEPDVSKYVDGSNINVYKYFTKEIADEIIKIGEKATDKLIPQIKALLEK